MKKKKLLLFSLSALLLGACSGNTVSSSDTPTSSDVPSSSDPASTSSEAPLVYNNQALAEFIAKQALKYDEGSTSSYILDEVKRLDPSFSGEGDPTNASFLLMGYAAFAGSMPAKRGARKLEFYDNPANPSLEGYGEDSPYTDAFRFFSASGIIDSSSFDPSASVDEDLAWTYLDRVHNYYGTSATDDFYSYANYDQRIANCPDHDATASDDSVYHINLVDSEIVNDWSREQLLENEDAYAYYRAMMNIGDSNVLSAMIEEYMAATTATELLNLLIDNHKIYGYSPLYNSILFSSGVDYFGSWVGEQYYALIAADDWSTPSASIAEGTEGYESTINEYAPLFSYLLNDETEGKDRATDYADFLYNVTVNCENLGSYGAMPGAFVDCDIASTGKKFSEVIKEIGFSDTVHIYSTNTNFQAYFNLFTDEHVEELKGYFLYLLINHYKVILPDTAIFNEHMGYPDRTKDEGFYFNVILPGYQTNLLNQYGQTEEYAKDAETINELANGLEDVMKDKIQAASWLSDEGKARSIEKLDTFTHVIGMTYFTDTSSELITFDENAYASLGSSATALDYQAMYERNLMESNQRKFGTDVVNSFVEGTMIPTVLFNPNAFYRRENTGIQVTLAMMICQQGIAEMTEEHLLGGLGFTLGHEIGHGFDSDGFNYNKESKADPTWMSDADKAAFAALTEPYKEYVEGYESLPGHATNGTQVLAEAVADNIGLSLSLTLGQKSDTFDSKIFFQEIAKIYGGYMSRVYFDNNVLHDTHPIQRARINRLMSTCDQFYEDYEVKEGDFMYVEPEERIRFY